MHACDIVAEALDIDDADTRSAYVESVCSADSALYERVCAMLEFHERNHEFLSDQKYDHGIVRERIGEDVGSQIGNYKLLEEIGEGGFGTVYLAEQIEPVRRKVAVKIIKLGMDTRQVVARFEAERQTLAMMDHPNIALVLDGGVTNTGRPYFVMELVNGISITEFCDENRLTIHERSELFIKVCDAVHHAHQKGIIHRDLKPSNILVTLKGDKPIPKVIDFGVAKAIDQRLTEHTLFTHFGQMIGTPQYMSPEQAQMSAHDVDIRSDIYTLGILFYELLTGEPPVSSQRLRAAGFDEMRRIIVEEDPPVPSSRMSNVNERTTHIAECRAVGDDQLGRSLRGDLDWIVMKTLSKDPDRRYASASDFAADLERHLHDEPVLARPPSARYRWQKFVKRNRALVIAGFTTAVSLLVGLIAVVMALWHTRVALNEAVGARTEAEITVTLLENLVAQSDPDAGKSPDYRLSEALDDFADNLPDLSSQPTVELKLRLILGRAYEQLALNEKTTEHLLRAISLQKQLFGERDLRVAATLADLAWVSIDASRFPRNTEQAKQYSQQAIDICRELDDASETMVNAHTANSFALLGFGETDRAEQVLEAALGALRSTGEVVDESRVPMGFARLRLAQERPKEALKLVEQFISKKTDQGVPESELPRAMLATCYRAMGEFAQADQVLLRFFESTRKTPGSYTFDERRLFKHRADLMRMQGRYTEAALWLDQGRDGMNKTVLAWLLPDWGITHFDLGHYAKVHDYCQQLSQDLSHNDEELNTLVVAHCISELCLEIMDPLSVKDDAIRHRADFEKAKDRWPDDYGMQLMYAWNVLRSEPDEEAELEKAAAAASMSVAAMHHISRSDYEDFRTSFPFHVLARAQAANGDYTAAIESQRQALQILSPDHLFLRGYYESSLVAHYAAAEKLDDAQQLLASSVKALDAARLSPEMQFHHVRAKLDLAEFLLHYRRAAGADDAERQIEDANVMLENSKPHSEFYRDRAEQLSERYSAYRAEQE